MSEEKETFDGKWYEYPIIRNAIISGLLTVSAFGMARTGRIPYSVEIFMFLVAIVIGGYHWSREGIQEFLKGKAPF